MNIIEKICKYLGIPQDTEEYKWSRTRAYQLRVEFIKNIWIGSGLIMLAIAQPAFILAFSLFLTFLSFAFLEK